MRDDMAKVVTERPRVFETHAALGTRAETAFVVRARTQIDALHQRLFACAPDCPLMHGDEFRRVVARRREIRRIGACVAAGVQVQREIHQLVCRGKYALCGATRNFLVEVRIAEARG